MSKIKILPEIVSNKIAAGEVVERPASVVKELVENAIDAGSSTIGVEVEKGGRSLIRVSDNGTGMNKDDALLSIERYATSKIYDDQDLYRIHTLGFRGEALPSIASVSRFTLITKDSTAENGTEIRVQGGKISTVSDAGAPAGTVVTVAQLFYNIPARRKFLKTIGTEMGHISDTVAGIALGRPGIRFKLVSDGKTIKDWSVAPNPINRAADVLGKETREGLLPVASEDGALSITGWVAASRFIRHTSRAIYLYVNGRHVRDRVMSHALFQGYGQRLAKGQYPMAVLFLTLPFDQVDVNVHPAKQEVRFARQKEIHDFLAQAVSRALKKSDTTRTYGTDDVSVILPRPRVLESVSTFDHETPVQLFNNHSVETSQTERVESQAVVQSPLWESRRFEDLRVIGQLHNTYILCESESGLVLIDQHAAHERILFEQLKSKSDKKSAEIQTLLIPETIEMGYTEGKILEKLLPDLKTSGVDIELFGKDTYIVKSMPAILSGKEVKPVIFEIVEKLADVGFAPGLQKTIDTCLILMACHGAIRANQSLSSEQMEGLIRQLEQCEHPSHCPHGRPTWVTWSSAFLEKSFGRTG